ncbi:PREDICTED: protein FAM192A [Camelina sativa]|uniref:Protein FAM192A n=1 Tax=Camelina sativa TaxID=90675 RepID=A0ABM0ZA49_CAMSA|nr:PREDICTED: protein FAM192A [Camelina sativa]
MAEDTKPIRLLNFVSEDQLDESKKERGERVEDGTFQRDRALFEILKENKDKKDAEFNERFKHRPPKALDEDETEFLDKLEMSKREHERQMANEEEEQLRSFQAAVAARSAIIHELKDPAPPPPALTAKEVKPTGKRNPATRPFKAIVKVKPLLKKAKATEKEEEEIPGNGKPASQIDRTSLDSVKGNVTGKTTEPLLTGLGLVSYSDESEDDD